MDNYLKGFIIYLQNKLGENLAGVIIYGSYVKGYFDPEKSDYDIFVIFKDKVLDIKREINKQFPKVSLQLYMNLEVFEEKLFKGGWNTYITFIFTGQILFQTPELIHLREKISKEAPNIKKLNKEQRNELVVKLKEDTKVINTISGFDLNKFLYASLLRKLQILYYLRSNIILLEFNELLLKLRDPFIKDSLEWLSKIESTVFKRDNNLVSNKQNYIKVLEEADFAIEKELDK